ncbi:hypothetical protein Hypma_014838 [Hypsizygus marmoreus]|uniref:DUF7918 domain-containing protein n=1 Tax=Hypsizygus marmoreus TaxID=39966 RepID=A0A369K437_HYPMA|nr:hypothetical protein Hypma_014838 [Hypsizygus marmoreus]
MLQLGDFCAWISVDDAEVPQYAIKHFPDLEQVICWIPSQADKQFAVCWKDPAGLVESVGYLAVDGIPCGAKRLHAASFPGQGKRIETVKKGTVSTSLTTERPLSFARLELTDDDLYLNIPASPELGDIRLDVFEVQAEGDIGFSQPDMPPDKQILHERTKKAVEHRVKLGDETQCQKKKFGKIRKVRCLCTFIFKYRPIEVLQANGIAPIDTKRKWIIKVSEDVIDLTEEYEDRDTKRVKTETKANIKKETEATIKKETKANVKTEITAEIKTDIKAEIKAEIKLEPKVKHEMKPKVKREPGRRTIQQLGGVIDLTSA